MAFSDFQYPDVLTQLGLIYTPPDDLFAGVSPLAPTQGLALQLPAALQLAEFVSTEKARSEWMIAPLLVDFWSRYHGRVGVYSGLPFVADPANGLVGVCDFLISRGPQQTAVTPPVVVIFEAKNESITGGLGQCVAAMVGAERANRAAGQPVEVIYGCVTTGTAWRFLRLRDGSVTLDNRVRSIEHVDQLLGILAHIVGPIPAA
ncbi:MAG: hypothetical protein MUF18_12975 [Fimbriiglobus sp.]|jgi:hypothetical protein|nr:hypothetical protein [Fimbriiglobus sp.]